MSTQLHCSDPIPLRSTYGRISFGGAMHHQVVSWSAPNAMDILVSQIWRGTTCIRLWIYPRRS